MATVAKICINNKFNVETRTLTVSVLVLVLLVADQSAHLRVALDSDVKRQRKF